MTVTDEDRAAAAECLETLLLATEPTMMSPLEAEQLIMRAFAAHRQAAYAAGLERAAVILEQRATMYHGKAAKSNPLAEGSMNLHDGFRLCAEASEFAAGDIRAEKDKTNGRD